MATSNRRTHRSLTPIFSAAHFCVTCPSRARFSQSSQSRSSWLIAIRSIPPALRLSRGTFYFAQLGTSHFAATDLLLTAGEHVLRRDIANGTVQADIVVVFHVALHQPPRILQRQRRSRPDA